MSKSFLFMAILFLFMGMNAFAQASLNGTYFFQGTQLCRTGVNLAISQKPDGTALLSETEVDNTFFWQVGITGSVTFSPPAPKATTGSGVSRSTFVLFNPNGMTYPPPSDWNGTPAVGKTGKVVGQVGLETSNWAWSYDSKASRYMVTITIPKGATKTPFEITGEVKQNYILNMTSPTSFVMTEVFQSIIWKKGKTGTSRQLCYTNYVGGKPS